MIEIVTSTQKEMPPLKYQGHINGLKLSEDCSCPPENCSAINREAFRYIFENDPKGESHKPGKLKSPKRIMPTDVDNCSLCALSCFESKEQAIKNYLDLISNRPNLVKSLGDSLAIGYLNEKSGLQTVIDETGHFDLFEFVTFDPYKTFIYVQKIATDNGNN